METTDRPPAYAFPAGHPSSPPMTPDARAHARFPPQTHHTSPIYKRMGLSRLAQSPPLDSIQPIGQGPQFHFRPHSREASSRPSTASGRDCATTPQDSENDDDSGHESAHEPVRVFRRVDMADVGFILEELDSDPGYDSDIEVVQPDHFEDAKSDKGGNRLEENGFLDKFKDLQCQEGSSDEEERQRIYRRKKKRWSAGIFKRSYSQSVEGDSSYSDNDPLDDVDSSARRLRRRVRGPSDRSIDLDERDPSHADHIAEVEEPDDEWILHSRGPPSIPSDDAFTLDELPFWVEECMDVEFDSS